MNDFGHIIEGVVALDPATQRYVVELDNGSKFDVQVELAKLNGQEVRLTLASFTAIEAIQELLLKGET